MKKRLLLLVPCFLLLLGLLTGCDGITIVQDLGRDDFVGYAWQIVDMSDSSELNIVENAVIRSIVMEFHEDHTLLVSISMLGSKQTVPCTWEVKDGKLWIALPGQSGSGYPAAYTVRGNTMMLYEEADEYVELRRIS